MQVPVLVDVDGHARRPWITWFTDCATNAVTGVASTPVYSSRESVLAGLRSAVLRENSYGSVRRRAGEGAGGPWQGLPVPDGEAAFDRVALLVGLAVEGGWPATPAAASQTVAALIGRHGYDRPDGAPPEVLTDGLEGTCPKAPHSPPNGDQHCCRLGMRA
ncbi:hypothetical protein ABZ876_32565 [Streptomyces sp. NPDC046931]|uniref:hypothetical protein n=1 Tax=Streptomyces sp. NPDC046931 TaxID=3154806 RepID=UPI0033D8F0F1